MPVLCLLLALGAGIALVQPVAAQPASGAAKPAAAPVPMKIGSVVVQGSFRTRLEAWDWFEADANNTYAFSGNHLRVSLSQNRERWDWLVEMSAPFLLGLPDDAVAPGVQGQLGLGANYSVANDRARNAGMVFAKQGWIRLKNGAHSLRLGRFEFSDGAETTPADPTLAWVKRERVTQRLIGPFGWSHTGRSFDGMHYVWGGKKTNITVMGARPTRGAFQVDGWGELDAAVGYAALTRQRSGKNNNTDLRLFGIYYQDGRNILKTDNRPLALRNADRANIRIGTFGGHLAHAAKTSAGTVDALLWGAVQTGRWGRLDHNAGSVALEAGWQPPVVNKLKPWIRAGYFHGSGDDDPTDNEHGTFFQILPTPRPYARMPFYDFVNNEDFMGMLILRPHRAVTLRAEAHALRLANRNDLWYLGGGAFQPWTFGYVGRTSSGNRGLATLYDVSADYNVNPHVTLTGYLAHSRGHSVVRSIYPRGPQGTFGYLEATYRF